MPRKLPRAILDIYSLLVRYSNKTPPTAARRGTPYSEADDLRRLRVRPLSSSERKRDARQLLTTWAPVCGVLLLCLALTYIAAEVVRAASSAHTPSVTNATTNEDSQTTSGLVISRNPLDGSEVTHFKIGNIVGGQLFKHDGTTQIPINSFVTFAEGNAGLKFTPSPNNWGTLTIEVYSSTSASDAGVGGIAERPLITVTPLGDTPSVTSATTNKNTQSRFGLVIRRNPVDGIEINYLKITNIQNGTLFKHDGTTQINADDFITFDDEGSAGLKFTPANNLTSPSSTFGFDAQASSSNSNAGLGGSTAAGSVGVYIPIVVTVNTLSDATDGNIGDGHCDTDGDLGNGDQCTLRAAIQETNSAPGDDTIIFTLPANSTITLNTALPDLNSLVITGPGAMLLTVQRSTAGGTPDFRVFTVKDDQGVTLSGVTVSNGRAVGASFPAGLGGGILNNTGILVASNCVITGNNASTGGGLANLGALTIESTTVAGNNVTGSGGGISNSTGATQSAVITISKSTISNNSGSSGGGIFNIGHGSITNSTISGNTAATGGGINSLNPLTLANVTISGNTASSQGGGIYNPGIGIITFGNTLIAGNTSPTGPDCSGFNLNSQDYNLIGNTSGGNFTGTTTHNITNVNALLGPLAANGGSTFTHALLVGSPAIDAANSSLTTDQRGQPRPIDDQTVVNAAGGNATDIGAYEAHNLEVNSTADTDDGLCRAPGTGNGCTLREAINASNAETVAELIVFAPALTSGGPATITLLTALPDLASDMTISGPGSTLLTIRRSTAGGTADFRIFTVIDGMAGAGNTVNISGLTLSNGRDSTVAGGGGILNLSTSSTLVVSDSIFSGNSASVFSGGGIQNRGTLTVTSCTFTGNTAANEGGALSNFGTLSVTNSTLSDNQSLQTGGGISNSGVLTVANSAIVNNRGSSGVGLSNFSGNSVRVTNTTISGNQAIGTSTAGAGIYVLQGTVRLTNCTLSDNHATFGSGIYIFQGSLITRNTVVAGNTPAGNCSSASLITSQGYNLSDDNSCTSAFNQPGDLNNVAALLGPLQDNGGPTRTHALLRGSPAIDAGDNCVVNNSCTPPLISAITTDQRGVGFNRIMDGNADDVSAVDIGAYEVQGILVTNTADSGAGSLRQAMTDANVNPGIDAINFQTGLTGTITLLSALPDLATSMDINGPGATQLTIQRSTAEGTPTFRIFKINSGQVVNISGLTLSNGSAPAGAFPANSGGALLNLGSLVLDKTVISGNTADSGGGISSQGPLMLRNTIVSGNNATFGGGISTQLQGVSPTITIADSTISGNSATGAGGGLFKSNLGGTTTLAITNSTISGNMAGGGGGGVYNSVSQGGMIIGSITNCTISGNTSGTTSGFGGGIANSSQTSGSTVDLTFSNSTISGNNVVGANGVGGGIANNQFGSTNTLRLHNNIVAGNFRNSAASTSDISSPVEPTSSFNLIGDGTGMTGVSNGSNGNMVGTSGSPILPLLGPLANNGGPAQTHALLVGSPALDAGNNSRVTSPPFSVPPFTDQRGAGFARIVDGPDADTTDTVDIGAFEAQVSLADSADQTINEDGSLSLPFNVGGAASITSVTATSSNTVLVPNSPANISISRSGSSRTLLINPVANAFGTSTITVTVNGNNSQTMTDTFVLTVNSANDAPSFIKGLDQTVNENDGVQTVNNWATNISPGPANESGQTVNFAVVSNSNAGLFSVAPAISSTGTLTYTPAAGASGTATISIALMDNGGTANGGVDTSATQNFNITVREGGALVFSAATYSVTEHGGSAAITVTRVGGSAGTATVLFATSNGTATAGDYTPVTQTITFNDGEASKTVHVPITDDSSQEPDETVNLTLSNAGGSGELGAQITSVLTIVDDDPVGGYLRFSLANFSTTESSGSTTITVERVGDSAQAVTVNYATGENNLAVQPCATVNGFASSRCDFTSALGTLRFAAGETSKTFAVLISQDNYVEGPETLTLALSDPAGGATLAAPYTATLTIGDDATEPATNPVDDAAAFVRQHYHDFLNREPDASGLAFWSNQITECQQPGATCNAAVRRINVSAAFFLSIEFQETGYLVERLYKTAYGDASGTSNFGPTHQLSVPIVRLNEFLPDSQQIGKGLVVGQTGWEQVLENNKVAFLLQFVQRSRFSTSYSALLTPAQFVDQLFANAGVTPSTAERTAAINEFGGAATSNDNPARARALRRVAENATLNGNEKNRAFVLMQYFGYLRRNPNDPQDTDYSGYDFWLTKLNQFNGNFVNADMVQAFIDSGEYRGRFGP